MHPTLVIYYLHYKNWDNITTANFWDQHSVIGYTTESNFPEWHKAILVNINSWLPLWNIFNVEYCPNEDTGNDKYFNSRFQYFTGGKKNYKTTV